ANDLATLRAIVAANAAPLAQARQSRAMPHADYGVRIRSPAYAVLLRHVGDARNLAMIQAEVALFRHATGDDAEAIETIRDVLRNAAAVDEGAPVLVEALVAQGIGL